MHILHINDTLGMGGAETYIVRLANSLVDRKVRVSIAAAKPWVLRDKFDSRVQVYDIALNKSNVKVGRPGEYWSNLVTGIPKLADVVKSQKVNLIHTHLARSAMAGWMVGRYYKVPTLHSIMHVVAAATTKHKLLFEMGIAQRLIHDYLVFSDYAAQETQTAYNAEPQHIHIARMGIDVHQYLPKSDARNALIQAYNLPPNAFIVGVVARFDPVKDIPLAIQTMASLRELHANNAFLLIAGDGLEQEYLERLSHDLNLHNTVRFLGRVNNTRELFSGFDVYLQTTRGPNLGLSALESLASGVPLLIAARSSDEELMAKDTLVEEDAGWIAKAVPMELAKQITYLMGNPDVLSKSRLAARRVAITYYDWEKHVDNVLEIYGRLQIPQEHGRLR